MIKKLLVSASMFVFLFPLPVQLRDQEQNLEKAQIELKQELNKRVQNIKDKFAKVLEGTVKTIDGQVLIVEKDGVSYKVNTSSSTKFRRKFWGVGKLSEISVGDKVSVYGTWANEDKTEINASFIRDLSVQLRYGVFFGEVKSISESAIVITSKGRGDQTVTVSAGTKLLNRKMESIAITDILVGHRIRVKGLWNNTAKTITEVKQIKDFSIPVLPSPEPEE
jgi:hypothetical protein